MNCIINDSNKILKLGGGQGQDTNFLYTCMYMLMPWGKTRISSMDQFQLLNIEN